MRIKWRPVVEVSRLVSLKFFIATEMLRVAIIMIRIDVEVKPVSDYNTLTDETLRSFLEIILPRRGLQPLFIIFCYCCYT